MVKQQKRSSSFTEREDYSDESFTSSSSPNDDDDTVNTLPIKDRDLLESIVPALLMRAYHLPGYSWRQDWHQYLFNNHPLFGICCHHKLHPVGNRVRIITLVGSVLFGLALTNLVYLGFVLTEQDFDRSFVSVQGNYTTRQEDLDENVTGINVTSGNLVLWTLGAAAHALYDNMIWSLAACTCFMEGATIKERMKQHQNKGVLIAMLAVVVTTALATFVVVLRATLEANDDIDTSEIRSGGLVDDEVQLLDQVDGIEDFSFIISYLMELGLSYIVWYPLIGTVLFSGVLGCFRLPILGGRPRDVMVEQREIAELSTSEDDDEFVDDLASDYDSDYELERDEEIRSTLAAF